MTTHSIDSLLTETRRFPPPPSFAAAAVADADLYDRAGADRLRFWADTAREYLHFAAHPEEHRLLLWTQLQGGKGAAGVEKVRSVFAERRTAVAAVQKKGTISDAFTVDDLFTMIFGITSSWMTAPGNDCGAVDDTEHQRRASIIEGAVRRLCAP